MPYSFHVWPGKFNKSLTPHIKKNSCSQMPVSHANELKADRPHLRYYPHTPPDHRLTDKHIGLVITAIALCCTQQSRAPNIDRCAPEI